MGGRARVESTPEVITERVPAPTLSMMVRRSAASSGTPASLSAFEVPGRERATSLGYDEQPTRRVSAVTDDLSLQLHPSSVLILAAMALVVGTAAGVAVVMRSQPGSSAFARASTSEAAPPPPAPPASIVVPPSPSATASAAAMPASSSRPTPPTGMPVASSLRRRGPPRPVVKNAR